MNTITLKGLTQKITALTLKSLEEKRKKIRRKREEVKPMIVKEGTGTTVKEG